MATFEYIEFQRLTMSGTGLKIWVGGWYGGVVVWWLCKPIIVFSIAQAEQKNS